MVRHRSLSMWLPSLSTGLSLPSLNAGGWKGRGPDINPCLGACEKPKSGISPD